MRVLPAETAMAIQERILDGSSIRQIMGEFGVAKGTVSRYRAIVIKTSTLRPRRDRPQPILEAHRSIVARGEKNILRLQKDVEGLSGKVSFAVTLVRPRPPRSQSRLVGDMAQLVPEGGRGAIAWSSRPT